MYWQEIKKSYLTDNYLKENYIIDITNKLPSPLLSEPVLFSLHFSDTSCSVL